MIEVLLVLGGLAIGAVVVYHFKAKVEADFKLAIADIKAELAKAVPSLDSIKAKVEALFKKL